MRLKFCGGLGHRAATCPKLESQRMKATKSVVAAAATATPARFVFGFLIIHHSYQLPNSA
ncbi:hypothetical protein T492DRAFT_875162 [Pavlovales sp. CCMP2436]|nr:hypothetical protein T492DRAFT_875162 [Pavlovales sp. CCMP2436]